MEIKLLRRYEKPRLREMRELASEIDSRKLKAKRLWMNELAASLEDL
jgi:hypothetical protein